MNNKIIIASLAMDLKRVALLYFNGSSKSAQRFVVESLKRKNEIDRDDVKPYLLKHINSLDKVLSLEDKGYLAENALMYSQIFQNYATTY